MASFVVCSGGEVRMEYYGVVLEYCSAVLWLARVSRVDVMRLERSLFTVVGVVVSTVYVVV